jgi:transglutaminase-like putative cysteine protease
LRKGHGNHHLQLLHANADHRYLGRGVCMELNSMVVEMIRHLGLPAAVATGWCFKNKNVTDPDHLFAVAFVRSPVGVCPLPLEAATGEGGREMEMPDGKQTGDYDIERVAPPFPKPPAHGPRR